MVSRLFGRGKKPTPQEPQPVVSTNVNDLEDEGFTIVSSSSNTPSKPNGSLYPSTSGILQPNVGPERSENPSQNANNYHFLDGVPFVLSCQCSFGGEEVLTIAKKINLPFTFFLMEAELLMFLFTKKHEVEKL